MIPPLAILLLAACPKASAQDDPAFRTVFEENWEAFETAPIPAGARGWEVMQQTDTHALVGVSEDGGRALRIIDDHQAVEDATCRLRHRFAPVTGRCLVRLKMMMRQGDASEVAQDMGLHLYDGGRLLLDVFFSGGELKTWQGPTWASLEPPVEWEDGRWYDIELLLDPPRGTVGVTVDGESHGTVKLRAPSAGLSMVELTSQRYALGELWVDDLVIANEVPPELRTQPSAKWEAASEKQARSAWFVDRGSRKAGGALVADGSRPGSMRRLVTVDMAKWPLLCLDVEPDGECEWTVYARPTDERPPALIEGASREFGRREYDLFALAAWQGEVSFELLFSARGKGRVEVSAPEIEESPPNEYLADPQSAWHFVKPSRRPNAMPDSVPLIVQASPADGPRQVRVSQGIPFPKGMLHDTDGIRLREALGPTQTEVLSVWDDGSVRWLLVDALIELAESGATSVTLTDGPGKPDARVPAKEADAAIALDTGAVRLSVPTREFGPLTGLPEPLDGTWDLLARFADREFRASRGEYSARIETNGPLRATIVIAGTLSDGNDHPFTYQLRLSAYRDSPEIELAPTFTLVTEAPEVQLQEMTLVLAADVPSGSVALGAEEPVTLDRAAGQTVGLLQDEREHFSVTVDGSEQSAGKHAAGWIAAGNATVAVRRFRQQFAKGLSVSDEGFRIELWSPAAPPRRFGRGAAKTHHILLSLASTDDPQQMVADFEHRPTLYPGAQWYFDSLGLGHFPIPSDAHAEMDRIYEAALSRRFDEQQRRADTSFDMVHYGDINHINSEIDAHKAFFMQWARTGERRWLDFALDGALHSQDIDVCHYSPNPREIGIHHSHYPSDHNNGGLTLTHTWIEGQLFRYYLTGDRRSLMAADLAGRAFARSMLTSGRMFDGGRQGGGMGSRAYGRACWALCELHRATHNPRYLWAMKRLAGYLLASLRDDGAVPASHDGAGRWNPSDECPHMAAICAVGLARYSELTGDETVLSGLERIAKWQMSRGAMPEKLGIMYHNYQGGEVIHFVDACADMLEAWAFLYDATGDPLYRDFAESVYDTMIEMNDRWRGDWTMGLRSVLLYLGRRDRWPDPPAPPQTPPGKEAAVEWLRSCQNEDGGFGVAPGLPSDMDSTFRAADALFALGAVPRDREACIEWIRSCRNEDGGFAGEPGWHSNVAWTWFALAALERLGVMTEDTDAAVAWLQSCTNEDGGSGASPVTGRLAYHAAWNSSCEYTSYKAQALRGGDLEGKQKLVDFLRALQVDGAGFRHRGGSPTTGYTMDALDGLAALGQEPSDPGGCAEWVAGLRREDGGYGWPGADRSTLRNTAHCILALRRLGRSPQGDDSAATAAYVRSCQGPEGGYGHAPGRATTVTATWYAVRALDALR